MKYVILAITLVVSSLDLLGQDIDSLAVQPRRKHEVSFDVQFVGTSILSRTFLGASTDVKYYPFERLATGISFVITGRKIPETFTYQIDKPTIEYYEFGWVNQYDLLQKERFRVGVFLNNGVSISRLGDDADREKYYTRYGTQYRAKKIATNYFYLVQPGIDFSVRIFGENHAPDFYLNAKARYRWVVGNEKYGERNDFNGYLLGFGLQLIGFAE